MLLSLKIHFHSLKLSFSSSLVYLSVSVFLCLCHCVCVLHSLVQASRIVFVLVCTFPRSSSSFILSCITVSSLSPKPTSSSQHTLRICEN